MVILLTISGCNEVVSQKQKITDKFETIDKNGWKYYYMTVSDEREIEIDVNVTRNAYRKYEIGDSIYFELTEMDYPQSLR